MISELEIQTFALAAAGVLLGSLARRAAELEAVEAITLNLAVKILAVEAMLTPALAAFSGAIILYFNFPWVLVLLLSVACGVGGFATSALILELLRTVLGTLANKIGAAK